MRAIVGTVILVIAGVVPATAQDASSDERPSIVVTTEVLGGVVAELIADAAPVTVLMEAGSDPHTWQPSARDAEAIFGADLVVANGLGLEEGMLDLMEQAEADGATLFSATDHITVREVGVEEHEADHVAEDGETDDEEGHEHGAGDPHFWLDPVAMAGVVEALTPELAAVGVDVGDRAGSMVADLVTLDAEIAASLDAIPDDRRTLVTGHDSLGYFADRYGLQVVGTVIPGLTTSGEPSARDLAELAETIRATDTVAVFTEVGTPQAVAQAVAAETGARLVELRLTQLPEDGSYASLLRELARSIVEALA